ncbi:outer membrane protein assembly factor BamB family protein [Amycolatopsis sp. NPDC004378]
MVMAISHRARYAAVPVAVLLVAGTAGIVRGVSVASSALYVWGLVAAAAGVAGLVFVALPRVRRGVRAGVAAMLAAVIAVTGWWVPDRVLAAQFEGTGVRWDVAAPDGGPSARDAFPRVEARVRDAVVVRSGQSTMLVSLADGHRIAVLPPSAKAFFSVTGDRLLVGDGHRIQAYQADGRAVWPQAVTALRGVAAGDGVVVVQTDRRTVSAISDDGSVRWTHPIAENRIERGELDTVDRFPTFKYVGDGAPSPILAARAVVPAAGSADQWDFLDPRTGAVTATLHGAFAATAGTTAFVSTADGHSCSLRTSAGAQAAVPCTSPRPTIAGERLYFQDGSDAVSVDPRRLGPTDQPCRVHGVSLESDVSGGPADAAVGPAGGVSYRGRLVYGWPGENPTPAWDFVSESELFSVSVAEQTTAVLAAVGRSGPFDDRSGPYAPRQGAPAGAPASSAQANNLLDVADYDTLVTVLDQQSGRVTGRVRARSVDSVYPVSRGAAVLVADGRIRLVGADEPQ